MERAFGWAAYLSTPVALLAALITGNERFFVIGLTYTLIFTLVALAFIEPND